MLLPVDIYVLSDFAATYSWVEYCKAAWTQDLRSYEIKAFGDFNFKIFKLNTLRMFE